MAAHNKMLVSSIWKVFPLLPGACRKLGFFDIDANGIVKSAKDKATGKEQASIKASGGLDDNDIDQMIKMPKPM